MDNLFAALTLLTRLPFYKIKEVPQQCYSHATSYWSLVGWLTGGIMALVYWLAIKVLPIQIAAILAIVSRVLVTGALHEDGLADFLDGFGGGHDRESTLRIMKDSHIGTYGVLGLILYYLFFYNMIMSVNPYLVPFVMIAADAYSKCVSSHITLLLPYARKQEESKVRVIYSKGDLKFELISLIGGLLALVPFVLKIPGQVSVSAILLPVLTFLLLTGLFRKRLQGYTGDCCGATFLLCELSFWLATILSL